MHIKILIIPVGSILHTGIINILICIHTCITFKAYDPKNEDLF